MIHFHALIDDQCLSLNISQFFSVAQNSFSYKVKDSVGLGSNPAVRVNLKGTYSGMRSGTGGGWNNHKAM
jgi:hypothetical protein